MADEFDMASWLFGGKRLETGRNDSTMRACIGKATSDSNAGRVNVSIGDDATTRNVSTDTMSVVDGDTSLNMPTAVHVKDGDEAIVAIVNHKPTVIGVVGRGDSDYSGIVDRQMEQEQAMQDVRDAVDEVAEEAAAVSEAAEAAIERIDDVETTVEGLDGDVDKIKTTIRGIAEDTDESISAQSTFEQTLASFLTAVESAYIKGQASIDRSAAISIANDRIDAKVTQSYIDGKVGTKYISRSGSYTTADSIVNYVTAKATLKGVLDDEYTAQSTFTQRSNEITATFNEQSSRIGTLQSYIRLWSGGILVSKEDSPVGAWVNSSGTFDIVTLTWSGTAGSKTPTLVAKLMTLSGDTLTLGRAAALPKVVFGDDRSKIDCYAESDDGRSIRILTAYTNNASRFANIWAKTGLSQSDAGITVSHSYGTASVYLYSSASFTGTRVNGKVEAYDDMTLDNATLNIDSTALTNDSAPSNATNGKSVSFRDSNDVKLGSMNLRFLSDGRQGIDIYARRYCNDAWVSNALDLWIASDGTRTVSVSDQAAWRNGIGAASIAGDTFTGNINRKNTSMDTSAATLGAQQYSIVGFTDTNNRYIAYLQASEATDGTSILDVATRRYNSSANKTNYVRMKMDKSNVASVEFSHPAAWRAGMGTLFYEAGSSFSDTVYVGGFQTNGGKDFHFTIPLTRPLAKTGTFTSLEVTARQNGSYILGSGSSYYNATSDGNATINVTYGASGLNVVLKLTASPGGTNNSETGFAVKYTFKVNN